MTKWRKDWFNDARRSLTAAETKRYGMHHDVAALESAKPFREAYFRAMIPHHSPRSGGKPRSLRNPKPRVSTGCRPCPARRHFGWALCWGVQHRDPMLSPGCHPWCQAREVTGRFAH